MNKKLMRIYAILIFLVCLGGVTTLWFFVRSPQNAPPRDIQILIEGSPRYMSTQNTLFRITDGNILEVMTFSHFGLDHRYLSPTVDHFDVANISDFVDIDGNQIIISARSSGEEWHTELPTGEIVTHRNIHLMWHNSQRVLSERQLNNIWTLAENVVTGNTGTGIKLSNPSRYVWAIVDGEMYQSYFAYDMYISLRENNRELNKNLMYLVYYFIDLSPISLHQLP